MPNASLALNQGGNVRGPSKNVKGVQRMPIAQVIFYHEKRLSALENNKSINNGTMSQASGAQTTTAIELLSQRLGKVEALLQQLQQQQEQEQQNTIQLEVEEGDEDEEQEEETE